VTSAWGSSENNRQAKFYTITRRGRRQLDIETAKWRVYAGAVFAALDTSSAVLAPTYDGGYSLIGQRSGVDILGTVQMSTMTVYDDLRANARERGITLHSLAATWDVDEVSDLHYLSAYLAGPHDAPATAEACRRLRLWEEVSPRPFVPRPGDRLSAAGGDD